jgi:hypothetical protein
MWKWKGYFCFSVLLLIFSDVFENFEFVLMCGVDFKVDCSKKNSGFGTGSTQPREYN